MVAIILSGLLFGAVLLVIRFWIVANELKHNNTQIMADYLHSLDEMQKEINPRCRICGQYKGNKEHVCRGK